MKNYFQDCFGLRLGQAVALSALLLGHSSAVAQEGDGAFSSDGLAPSTDTTSPSAPPSDAGTTTEQAAAEPAPSTEASGTVSTTASASTEAGASADAAVTTNEAAPASVPGETKSDRPTAPPLAIEVLPPTAYPNNPQTGLRGGSLSMVMSGMQWPYMPAYGDDQPKLRIGVSGSSWVDFNYKTVRPGLSTTPDIAETRVQGRLTLRLTPVYNFKDGWFGQSRIELVGITEQQNEPNKYVDLDEAWVRFGKWNKFDLTVGRTQGFEVYHFGMGLEVNTQEREGAASLSGVATQQAYALTELWDRGINNGAAAIHFYMPQWLRLELLGRMGATSTGNDIGVRPAAIVDLGWLKLKGGYEFRTETPTAQQGDLTKRVVKGFGGQVNFVFDPWIEFGGGAAYRIVDRWRDTGAVDIFGSNDTLTFGGFLNVRPYFKDWLVGIGYHNTQWKNFNYDAFGYPEDQIHQQMFAAVQYQLWDRFFFKYVAAYSTADIETREDFDISDTGYVNQQFSHRVRFMMLF